MAAATAAPSHGLTASLGGNIKRVDVGIGFMELQRKKRRVFGAGGCWGVKCCCSGSVVPIRGINGSGKCVEKCENWRFDSKKISRSCSVKVKASSTMTFASPKSRFVSKQEQFFPRCTPRNSGPQSHDSPPKRDTGIANEKEWGIDMLNENVNESGTNEDGSTWYRESGENIGENGYRCRWTKMGGQSHDGASEWKEMVHMLKVVLLWMSKDCIKET